MIPLDRLADDYYEDLPVPAGLGVERVMLEGARRRQRRRATMVTAAAFGIVAVGVLGIAVVQVDRSDEPDQSADTAPIEVMIDTDALPVRDDTQLPLVATPRLDAWTVEPVAVSVTDRFSDAGTITRYELRSNQDEVTITVFPGQVDVAGEPVILERAGRTRQGGLTASGDGPWTVEWNERPGANTGIAVAVSGGDRAQVVDIANRVEFVDLPLVGAGRPEMIGGDPARTPEFVGTTNGENWTVSRSHRGDAVIEIGGESPRITSSLSSDDGVDITTISKNGLQVSAVEVPTDTESVSVALPSGERVALPLRGIDGTDRKLAVAAIPPDRDAAVLEITHADGTTTSIGLPSAPPQGWTTSSTRRPT